MSSVSSPSAVKSAYAGTPQHLKTLDVLGKTKDFQKLGHLDLVAYCELARTKYFCKSYADVLAFLEDKYGWEVNQRETDLELAWEALVGEGAEKSDGEDEKKTGVAKDGSSGTSASQSWADIPVVLKGNSTRQTVLICQVDDENLQFAGDSGAVGRIFCDPQSLRLDLKGRQYSAQLTAGPTLMVLNLAPPVGQSSSSSKGGGLCARAEVVTNEFCHLTFEKDLHGTLQGVYTGEDGENHEFNPDDASDSEVEHGPNKKKKVPSSGKKSKATASAEDGGNPKISTITQRKRKSSSTGKKSTSTKKSKSK